MQMKTGHKSRNTTCIHGERRGEDFSIHLTRSTTLDGLRHNQAI